MQLKEGTFCSGRPNGISKVLIQLTLCLPRTAEWEASLESWPLNSAIALSLPGARVPVLKDQGVTRLLVVLTSTGQRPLGFLGLCFSVPPTSQIFFFLKDVRWLVSKLLLRVAAIQGDGCEVHRWQSCPTCGEWPRKKS